MSKFFGVKIGGQKMDSSKKVYGKFQNLAKGLIYTFYAVNLAISSNLSNGFVEGINNKIKLIKYVMFGRCSLPLLKSKIILPYFQTTFWMNQ